MHKTISKNSSANRRGFTLIELLVAISLFAIAIAIAAGGFVRALRTQRALIALISANSSASLAIEQMAREIRTGTGFECNGVAGICTELSFTNAAGEEVQYLTSENVLQRESGTTGNIQPLTPSNTEVRRLSFILFNDVNYPPRITILMGVSAKTAGIDGGITNLQTTVSSRNF